MRQAKLFAKGLFLSLGLIVLTTPSLVGAFSAYGGGTSLNPYRIATCTQLQEINNDLSGYYVLVSNIDCTGFSFQHIDSFTGTLDGQNHTIAHLNIDSNGLFGSTDGATVKNITIESGSVGSNGYLGSFAGQANNSVFSNLHSSMTVTDGGSAYSGGLVGSVGGTTSISESSFSGTYSGSGYGGGIVGAMWDAGTSVSDCFVAGTVNSLDVYVGAAIGGFFNGTVSRIYSSATFNLNGHIYDGGLIGDSQGVLNDSFSATTFVGTISSDGAITGYNVSGTYSNVFFDRYLANTATLCGTGSGCSATAANVANATPDYFKNNTTAGPLGAWDFVTKWQTTASYPTLRNISAFTDAIVPNSGDANGDGTLDSYQANVASVQNNGGAWSTAETPSSNSCTITNTQAIDANAIKADSGFTPLLTTMTSFDIYCPTAGQTVSVTAVFDKQYSTSNAVLRHYNPTTHVYSTISGAVFGTRTVDGVAKTTATYSITDGGAYDTDGLSNGIIKDPVGISAQILSPDTGFARQGVASSLVLYSLGLLTIVGAFYARKKAN